MIVSSNRAWLLARSLLRGRYGERPDQRSRKLSTVPGRVCPVCHCSREVETGTRRALLHVRVPARLEMARWWMEEMR